MHGRDPQPADLGALRFHGPVVLVLAAALALFFAEALAPGALFFTHDLGGSDLLHQNLPFRQVLLGSLGEGRLPFWVRDMGTGFPLLAEGQVGALYPPNLLLLWLLPLPQAVNLFVVSHLLLAGLAASVYARSLGLGRVAATFAALVFALCGFLVVHVKHMNMVASAAWIPLLLAAIEHHFRASRPARTTAAVALVCAAMVLAGHPQVAYNGLLVAGLYAAARAVVRLRGAGVGQVLRRLALLLGGVGLGLGLAAPQLLPTAEMAGESGRAGGVSWEEATRHGYHPRHLVTFVAPYRFGDPADDTWPKLVREQQELWPGVQTVFWEITGYVGRIPLLLTAVALVWAVRRLRSAPPGGDGGLGGTVLLLAGLSVLCLLLVLGKFTPVFGLFFALVPGFDAFRFPTRFLLHVDLFLAVLGAVGLELATRRLAPHMALGVGSALLLLAAADLFWFGRHHNPVGDAARWLEPTPVARALLREEDPFRVQTVGASSVWERANTRAGGWRGSLEPYLASRNMPVPNANLSQGFASLDFYTSFYPERLELTRELGAKLPLRLVGAWNVKYLISAAELRDPFLERRGSFPGPTFLYENGLAQPRAFVAFAAERHPDLDAVKAALASPLFDPAVVHLEDPADRFPLPAGPRARPVPARELSRAGDGVEFEAQTDRPAVFFASELFYPGRFAELDGEPVELFPANGLGVAVALPPGRHRVTLRYRCRPFEHGLVIAAVSALGVGLLAFGRPRRSAG